MRQLIFSTFLLASLSCNPRYEEVKFPKEIEYFNSDFYSHFPSQIPTGYIITVSQNNYKSHPFIWLQYFDNQEHIDSLETKLATISIGYDSNDSCLLVIDKHLNTNNWRYYDKRARMPREYNYKLPNCSQLSPPMPKFYEDNWYESSNSIVGLDGWILYVLDSKSGIFMDDAKLPNGLFTPPNWEHGYSKGVALNKNKNAVIYWADIW